MTAHSTYDRLLGYLDERRARYRVIEHAPEGATEAVSDLRGHPAREAAKCLVLRAKSDRERSRYVLAVIPGDRRIDLARVKELLGARYVGFADPATAQQLALSPPGTVLPFAFREELELIADPALLEVPTIYFNAARLDRSLALETSDYRRVAQPRLATMTHPTVDDT